MSKPKFKAGDKVVRAAWEFAVAGTVVASFENEGVWMYVVNDGMSFWVSDEFLLDGCGGQQERPQDNILKHGETVYLRADKSGTPLTAVGYFFRFTMFIVFKNGVHGEPMIHEEHLLTRKNPRLLQDPQSP